MNQNSRLTPHFKLGELCKTKYVTADGNIPSRAVIENLIRVCGWLEELRVVAGVRPQSKVFAGVRPRSKVGCAVVAGSAGSAVVAGVRPQSKVAGDCTLAPELGAAGSAARAEAGGAPYSRNENTGEAIVINSGYRSPEVNRLAGGVPSSNHVTGCAVDIRCAGKEQMIRYAAILLDIADETKRDFDELLLEQHGSVCWLHFAVRPMDNRRKIAFLKV
ncbi:MAG: hypothetical protein IKN58_10600 [Prevotella sp.]|nr:hypothetical protein [Prevotella sp.]